MTAVQSDPASMLMAAGVPAFKCPPGTKMHILDLGTLQADESWFVFYYLHCTTTVH